MHFPCGSHACWILTTVALAQALPATAAPEDRALLELRVRDSDSGEGIAARLFVSHPDGTTEARQLEETGSQRLQLAPGSYPVTVASPGHRELRTTLVVDAAASRPVTLWLDPERLPDACATARARVRHRGDVALFRGHVVDALGRPVADASVRLEGTAASSTTDRRGGFSLEVEALAFDALALPPTVELRVGAEGFRDQRRRGIARLPGATHLIVELQPGTGIDELDDRHKLLRPGELPLQETAPVEPAPPEAILPRRRGVPRLLASGVALAADLAVWPPPASIRVGTGCTCKSCGSVDVMSLETYVKRGLNDEWIASWDQHALRAGAVAYRSYGVWHVENPLDPAFDICSTTCCQAYDTDTHTGTDLAVDRTPGILLERAGAIFRSEYSAENNGWDDPNDGRSCSNNDLCGDGFAGSPSTGWPCLSDPFDATHGCFGHGRGMCQWGTQRWATLGSQLWKWSVDHYYNDNDNPLELRSAYMTSPLTIDAVTATPAAVEAGDSTTFELTVQNLAELSHEKILIGGSLWSAATGYIDDPPNDTPVVLSPGGSTVSRPFDVPAGTPDGIYDVVTSLWLDVDEDALIASIDLATVSHTRTGGLEVCSAPIDIGDSLRADRGAGDSVTLSWIGSANATSYGVHRATAPDGPFAVIGTTSATTFADPAPPDPVAYYRVTTRNSCGESPL